MLLVGEAPMLAESLARRGVTPFGVSLDRVGGLLPLEDASLDYAIVLPDCTHGALTLALAEIARALRPGGGVYVGVPHRWRSFTDPHAWTVAGGRRALREAGFSVAEAYGVRESTFDLRLLVPIEDKDATRWFLTSRASPYSAREALLVRALARAPSRFGARVLFPHLGFVTVRADGTGSGMDEVVEGLRSSLPASATEATTALAGPVAVVPVASRWAGRVVYAVIPRGGRVAAAILKADTSERGQRRLRAEQAALERFGQHPALAGRMPVSLGLFATDAGLVLAQSGMPGIPLHVVLRRRLRSGARSTRRDHALVTDWLRALRAESGDGTATVDAETVARGVDAGLPTDVPRRREIIGRVTAVGESLGPLRVPLLPVHGDLGPSNCLVSRDGLRVVDWEAAVQEGDPLAEIVLFLSHYARRVPASDRRLPAPEAAFRRAFTEKGWLAQVTDRTWRGQLLELRLPAEAADYLLVATLARLASGEATTAHAGGRLSQRYWGKALTSFVTRRSLTRTSPRR